MSKYYFVAYHFQFQGDTRHGNVILKDIHPVIWAGTTTASQKGLTVKGVGETYLDFWAEIDEDTALHLDVQKWCNLESD